MNARTLLIAMLLTAACVGVPAIAAEQETPTAEPAVVKTVPRVEVCFVLDTTGSMSGLIEGAKKKIWYIANQIILGEPRPAVKFALVPFRDKGDAYVTKVYDLSDNIDKVYADLKTFQAQGGGDRNENVNQALHDAVHKVRWSEGRDVLKIVYLVGDSPPHNEYQDVPTYDKTAKAAIKKGIYVNTILCGGHADTGEIWKEIARRAEGTFLAIAQDGGAVEIVTPYDEELTKLNGEMMSTAVVYGEAEVQAAQTKLNAAAGGMAGPAAADRLAYAARSGEAAKNDLVSDLENEKIELAEVDEEMLPDEMKAMDAKERERYVAEQQAKRKKLLAKITDLTAKRDAYVKEKQAKMAKEGAKAGFDLEVVRALRAQAEKKGITYKE